MKAELNKKYEEFLKVVDILWKERKEHTDLGNFYFISSSETIEEQAKHFSDDLCNAIEDAVFPLHRGQFSTKKQLIKYILESTEFSFYEEFVKFIK